MEEKERQFKEGFNNGYLISLHKPDLFKKLEKGLTTSNEYIDGFRTGGKEVEKEKEKEKTIKVDKIKPDKTLDRDIDLER